MAIVSVASSFTLPVAATQGTVVGPSVAGYLQDIRAGTAGTPDSSLLPTFKVSRTQSITQSAVEAASGVTGDDAEWCTAAIHGVTIGTSTSEVQATGVYGAARNDSTGAGPHNDAAGVVGRARATVTGTTGDHMGGFFASRKDTGNTGNIQGVQIAVENYSGSNDSGNTAGGTASDGIFMAPLGSNRCGTGINFAHPNGWQQWDVGISFASNSGGPTVTADIRSNSSATYGIDIQGTHATAALRLGTSAGVLEMTNNIIDTTSSVQFNERTDPGNGTVGANKVQLYCRDDGSGHTQLIAMFSDNTKTVLAAQP